MAQTQDVTDTPEQRVTFMSVLRHSGFRNLWLGQIISQMGDYFAFLATMVVVSGFSDDPQQITLMMAGMMICQALPRLIFGMLAGVFVDRWDRRRTMMVSDIIRAGLALLMIPAFLAQSLPAMYALGFILSAVGTLFNPAKGALIPKLVPQEMLTSANSLSQTSMMLATFLGPAVAGAAFKIAGPGNEWVAFVFDSVSFVVSAIAISFISVPGGAKAEVAAPLNAEGSAVGQVWQELKVGIKALFLSRTMGTLAIVFGVTMLGIGAVNTLWVTFLKVNFGFGSTELAWRISLVDIAFSAGMVIASLAVGNYLSNVAPKWFIVVGLTVAGAFTIPLGLLPSYWLVVGVMFIVGLSVAPINTGATTIMQVVVPNEQLGRVGAGINTVVESATLTSMALGGAFGAVVGIPFVFGLGGVLCLGAGLLAWVMLPSVTLKDKPEVVVEENAPAIAEPALITPLTLERDEDLLRVG